MFFNTHSRTLKQYLRHHVPANRWYTASKNGVTLVAHSRFIELNISEWRLAQQPGQSKKFFDVAAPGQDCGEVMYFTSKKDLREALNDTRYAPGVVGDMKEFIRFCDHFVVSELPQMEVVDEAYLINLPSGWTLGRLSDTNGFDKVLQVARNVVVESKRKLG